MSSSTYTQSRIFQWMGILLALGIIAVGYYYYRSSASTTINKNFSDPLGEGLVGYWPLDDGTSGATPTTAADSSLNGKTGTLTNGPTWTTGQIGSAVDFDGSNDYLTMGDQSIHEGMATMSLAGWIKMDTLPAANYFVITKSSVIGQYRLAISSTGIPTFVVATTNNAWYSAGTTANGATALTTSTWIHLLGTYDGQYVRLYVNGVLAGTGSQAISGAIVSSTSDFRLSYDSYGNYFNGQIDEVRLYNRSLSDSEAAQLFRLTSLTGVDTSLKGYWSFDGNAMSGTTAYDRSGAGNNGTLTNGPTKTIGKVGQALSFDGSNDYANIPSSSNYDSSTGTWMFWAKIDTLPSTSNDSILSRHDGTNSVRGINMMLSTSGKFCFQIKDASAATNISACDTQLVNDGKWHHVALAWNQSNGAVNYLYIDGQLGGSATNTVAWTFNGQAVRVADSADTYWEIFDGSLDDLRIYNRALSAAEIKSLYDTGESDKSNTSASQPQGTGRLDSGLAGYWKLDDGSGTSATDSSTNANTGTLTNGPTWTTGQIGGAVDFDGVNDYIISGNANTHDLGDTADIGIALWFNRDTFTTDDILVAKRGSLTSAGFQGYIAYIDDATDQVIFEVSDGTDEYSLTSTATFTATGWNHVVINWDQDSATGSEIYINGVANNAADSGTIGNVGSLTNIVSFCLAAMSDEGLCSSLSSEGFDGKLDEVRIYNRVLSSDEVGQLYRLTSPSGTDTSLKGYWSFNGKDVSGTTAYDRSGSGLNGTLTSGPTVTKGRVGQALDFDGTDDYVTITDADDTKYTGAITLCTWAKIDTGSTYRHFMGKHASNGATQNPFDFRTTSDTIPLLVLVRANTDSKNWTGPAVTLGAWKYYCVTAPSAIESAPTFYIDGVAAVPPTAGGTGTGTATGSGAAIRIGVRSDSVVRMDGSMDEVRIYNRALSAAEIKSLYDASESDKSNTSASQPQGTGRLDSGLAGYWKLDDASGTTATDSSTNGNTGTLTNGPTWTTGQIGGAVSLDGNDDYLTMGDPSSGVLDFGSDDFSISFWMNGAGYSNQGASVNTAVAKRNDSGTNAAGYTFTYPSTNIISFAMGNGSATYTASHTVATTGDSTWHYYVGVRSGTSLYLFVDGTRVATTGSVSGSVSSTTAFQVGDSGTVGTRNANALFDEIRAYNRALSADEVGQLYHLTSPSGTDTSLKGYWSFDGNAMSGTTAYDRSGAGNNGTLTNGPTKTIGKVGQALQFDGTDDYVDAGSSSTIQSLDQLSVAAWVYIANYPVTGDDYIHAIVSTQNDSGSYSGWTLSLGSYADATKKENVLFEFRNTGNTAWRASSASTTELALNTWYHVVATYDQTNIKLYINGVIDTTTPQTDTIADGSGLYLGRKYAGSAANRNWDGKMDEVRIYNRALTSSEISALYNAGR